MRRKKSSAQIESGATGDRASLSLSNAQKIRLEQIKCFASGDPETGILRQVSNDHCGIIGKVCGFTLCRRIEARLFPFETPGHNAYPRKSGYERAEERMREP